MSESRFAPAAARALLAGAHRWRAYGFAMVLGACAFALVAIPTFREAATLGRPQVVSGYALFALFVVLAGFNLRKRLRVLPLIAIHWWTVAHVVGGVLGLALFWLHTATLWPRGAYEQLLATLVYFVSLSGIAGLLLQQYLPQRLTRSGVEVLYERIPVEISQLKRRAEGVVLECTRVTGHDTLARFYVETLQWFFFRPRFLLSHITGTQAAEFWLEQNFNTVRRYLNEHELEHLEALAKLAEYKNALDAQHTGQLLLRGWLLAHVPAAAALMVMATWHLLLVHVYAL